MLAHFKHFNLAPLLENLNVRHVLLLNLLNCDAFTCLLVHGKLDKTELALTQRLVQLVELEDVDVSHGYLKAINPHSLILLLGEKD